MYTEKNDKIWEKGCIHNNDKTPTKIKSILNLHLVQIHFFITNCLLFNSKNSIYVYTIIPL